MTESADPRLRFPLEPTTDEMEAMGRTVVRYLSGFVDRLPASPTMDLDDLRTFAASFRRPAPDKGRPFEDVVELIDMAAAKGVDTANPGFLGYVPGGGLYASALAAHIAFALNRFVTMWELAPGLVQLEANVVRWLGDMFDHPPEGLGILTSGGSLANFTAVVTARSALLGEDFLRGTVFTSEHTHHSVRKAAMMAGLPPRNVRLVETTPDLKIDVDALNRRIDDDRASGLEPFLIVGNAGTTSTGTVDPLVDLVSIAHERRMWIHVDAAYGGFFQLTDRGSARLRGIVGADSITLDPHKGMFLPYGTGCLLVRDGARLRAAHHVAADYMQDRSPEEDVPNFADYSPELSRDFRGLRVWLPLQLHGLNAFREALDEKLDLAEHVDAELRRTAGFELPWETELSTVAFRFLPGSGDVDAFNGELLTRINASRRVFLSSTTVRGRFVLRVCILSHRTHRDRVEEALDVIKKCARELADGGDGSPV